MLAMPTGMAQLPFVRAALGQGVSGPNVVLSGPAGCGGSPCPADALPTLLAAGEVTTFQVRLRPDLAPGSYEARVALAFADGATAEVPLRFTVT